MGRSFKTRARSRARRQEKDTGLSLVVRVKCSHGEMGADGATHHPLTIILNKRMVVKHISSACAKRPADESEAAVMRGLLGDNEYVSCAWCVDHVRTMLRTNPFSSGRKAAAAALEQAADHPSLISGVVNAVKRRTGYVLGSDEENCGTMRMEALDALVRGLTPTSDRFGGYGPANWKWDVVVSGNRLYARVAVGWTGKNCVAAYCGAGRWQIDFNEVEAAARKITGPDACRDDARRYTCPVCNVRVGSMAAHNKSARHLSRFQNYVLDQLAIIGGRLNRRNESV